MVDKTLTAMRTSLISAAACTAAAPPKERFCGKGERSFRGKHAEALSAF